eukprot:gene45428-55590_t
MLSTELKSQIQGAYSRFLEAKGLKARYGQRLMIAEVAKVLDSFGTPYQGAGTGPTHIFNLGHGISQFTPPEHVAPLLEAVHASSRAPPPRCAP